MMQRVLLRLLRFYQRRISPLFPPMCRYYPTCSAYAVEAVQVHGAFRGSFLALLRFLRCNPLFPGGYDPVPPKNSFR
ncbi:MAG: membrane protein insertion efficiency factor YidD [Oscillospiraceae bacterium]|jgi:putative membrane protein insertion efficiency factor|nr:membrane protein insertion efficiency factor YidD [Oscillospiraceae bacterium]